MAWWARGMVAVILGSLAACSSPPLQSPSPTPGSPASTPVPAAPSARSAQRWVAADWRDLPGWGSDDLLAAWPALLAGCQRPAPGWAEFCARAALQSPADPMEAAVLLMKHLRPWRLAADTGETTGLLTGYFEPQPGDCEPQRGKFEAQPSELAVQPSEFEPQGMKQAAQGPPLQGARRWQSQGWVSRF